MERTPEIFEKIERYLTNRLSPEELVDFENEIANNPKLQSEIETHKTLHNTLSDQETLLVKEKLIKVSKEVKKEESSFVKSIFSSPLKIAATIIMLLGISAFLWNTLDSTEELRDLYVAHYTPFPAEDITRGQANTTLQNIMDHYNKGAYEKVITTLEKNTNLIDQNELSVYLGISYLNTSQEQKAILQFERVSEKNRHHEASRWYLSLTYLKLNDTQRTIQILEEIIKYNGVYKNNAARLLRALNE